jgi:hypothetical protein
MFECMRSLFAPQLLGLTPLIAQANANGVANELGKTLIAVGVGLGLIGFGGYAIWLGLAEQSEAGKAKFRRDSMAAYGYVKPPIPWSTTAVTLGIGCAIIAAGVAWLLYHFG